MVFGPVEDKTTISCRNMDGFERYKNAIDIDSDSEDVTFAGYVNKVKLLNPTFLNNLLTLKV